MWRKAHLSSDRETEPNFPKDDRGTCHTEDKMMQRNRAIPNSSSIEAA
jgi:hypothetical protein